MVRETVQVEVEGAAAFFCEVQSDIAKLDWYQMPKVLVGTFSQLPSRPCDDPENARRLFHAARTKGGASHRFWVFDRYAYRFQMISATSLEFTAELDSIKPFG